MAEILKQNQGNKILRQNQGGKILKANYNFGKAFEYFSIAESLRIPYLIGQPYNFVGAFEVWTNGNPFFQRIIENNLYYFVFRNAGEVRWQILSTTRDIFLGTNSLTGVNQLVFNTNNEFFYHQGSFKTDFNIPISGNYTTFFVGGTGVNRFTGKIGLFRAYSSLTANEITNNYNKGLGNDSLTIPLFELRMNQAEILDFSAAQDNSDLRVGVRNFGSIVNGHGEIIGLPAGTLQEKVDFANANLFVNFL